MGAVVIAVLVLPGLTISTPAGTTTATKATWTYAIYLDGDNGLAACWGQYTLPFLEKIPASKQVNIVVLLTLKGSDTTQVLKFSGSKYTVVETHTKMDMGIGSTVSWWINRSTQLFPSTYYAMDLWDHGWGWHYVMSDEVFGHRILLPSLEQAIKNSGKRIDVMMFDACNMANTEALYQISLANLVSYVCASEETVSGIGIPYDKVLMPLVSTPTMNPKEFAVMTIDAWGEYYYSNGGGSASTFAAIDMSQIANVFSSFTTWSGKMLSLLPSYATQYTKALKATYCMQATHYFPDLYDYSMSLLGTAGVTDRGLIAATMNLGLAAQASVVKAWDSRSCAACYGLQFYWGINSDWRAYATLYQTNVDFPMATGWWAFLDAYNAH
jgi:hypothetical protein